MPGERTEQATQHRREKARKEGDILHSRELSHTRALASKLEALGVKVVTVSGELSDQAQVDAMLDARRADECLASGRRNCSPVVTPQPLR